MVYKQVIFLDVDGVLNNTNYTHKIYNKKGRDYYFKVCDKDFALFDHKSLRYIRRLIKYFDNELLLVISSTWRKNKDTLSKVIEKITRNRYIYSLHVDTTKVRPDNIRGLEIRDYLEEHNLQYTNFVIIDDDDFNIIHPEVPDYSRNFVKCNHLIGFKKEEYKRALKILRGEFVEKYIPNSDKGDL